MSIDFIVRKILDRKVGDQDWLSDKEYVSKYYSDRACGVTAAANVAQYMAAMISGKSNLYQYSDVSKNNYTSFMNDIYQYLSPAVYGIPGIKTMQSGMQNYASSKGVSLSSVLSNESWSKENTISYIRDGLSQKCPVLMITWNSKIPNLETNWLTITNIYRTYGGSNMFVCSNWGGRIEYNYDVWFDDYWGLYKGLLYFN